MAVARPVCAALMLFALFFGAPPAASASTPLDFTTIRLGAAPKAALVVGGIQGDEPGGFSAATLLATRYEISKGAVWVVPNLNFPSIIRKSRGLHGDMNRKFARLDENDPEFSTVRRIQALISQAEVSLVLNLHDGSGFYRPRHENNLRNPRRWGQSIIIDQASLGDNVFMGDLAHCAETVAAKVNKKLIDPGHALHVRDTKTAAGDLEMAKSLSWYAARNGKAAFGLEASKEFPVAWRAYYHLSMIEAFLTRAGIEFQRDFELTPKGVEVALSQRLGVSFAGNRVFLPLDDARPSINLLPLPRGQSTGAIASKPIMAVLPCASKAGRLCVHYGNRTIANIRPDWRDFTYELDAARAIVDGESTIAPFGQILEVGEVAIIEKMPGFRVNVIGFNRDLKDEAGVPLRRRDLETRFSVDRAGTIFRVEIYKGSAFAGMFLLRFKNRLKAKTKPILPATKGPESGLGF